MRAFDAVLFDVGNTLLMLDHDTIAAVAATGVRPEDLHAGEPKMWRDLNTRLGDELEGGAKVDILQFILETLLAGCSDEEIESAVQRLVFEHSRFSLWRRINREAHQILGVLRRLGLRVGVVSNSDGRTDALLERTGLKDEFEVIVDSCNVGIAKPDPEIFRIAARRLGVNPARVMYVGDLPIVDVVGAASAAMSPVLYDPGNVFETDAGELSSRLGCRVTRIRELSGVLPRVQA
jgi:putative hydrolase of the HAD superfamily